MRCKSNTFAKEYFVNNNVTDMPTSQNQEVMSSATKGVSSMGKEEKIYIYIYIYVVYLITD